MSIVKERAHLLNELVRKLCAPPLTPDDHPKRAAVERLVKNGISFHTFLDTYPDVVEAEWSEIVERLEINAQFDKARVLAGLTRLLLSTQEPSIQRDYPYRVLSFLIASSRNIIGSFVDDDASQMALQILSEDELINVVEDETLQEDSDDDWWRMHISYDSGDTLSEWSQDLWSQEEEPEKGARSVDSSEDVEDGASFHGEDSFARRPLPARRSFFHHQNNPRGQRYPLGIESSLRTNDSPYDPNSLTVWLAAQLSGGNPAQHLEPRLCLREQNIVQQILKMFQGVTSPGPSFCFDTLTRSYKAVAGVHTSQCSPFVLQPLLEMFAEIATRMNRIDVHCTDIIKSCSGLGSRLEVAKYPTVVSCAAALNQHIRHFRNGCLRSNIPSLVSLYVQMCGTWKHYVCFIDEHVLPFLQACSSTPRSAPSFSSSLLNALHRAIKRFGMLSGATGGALVSLLMDLLCNAIMPTLDAVQEWLTSGSLENAPPEFFIKEKTREMGMGQSVDIRVSSNWEERYRLEMDEASGEVAVPDLLKPLASSILSTGAVAAAMMQTVKTESASWERSSAGSLFTSFCNAVQTDLVKHASFTTAPVTSKEEKNNREVRNLNVQSAVTSSHRCILEWTAASSRAATGDLSMQSVCVLEQDDLEDLEMLPSSILELEAAQTICPPETALYYVDKCIHSPSDHPISQAMLASFWSKLHELNGNEQTWFSNIRDDTMYPKENFFLENSEAVEIAEQQFSLALGGTLKARPAWDGNSGWSEWYHRTVQALDVQDMRPSTRAAERNCFESRQNLYATTVLPHQQSPVLWSSAPPADFVVKHAIEAVLSVYMQEISETACQKVLNAGLVSQLSVMRSFVVFSFPAIANFVNVFVLQSSTPQGVGGVSLIDVNSALEMAIASCQASVRTFQDFSILGLDGDGQGECEPAGPSSSIPSYVEVFQHLKINMKLKWPVSMFMEEGMVQVYKNLMILTLQLEWCRQSLLAMHPATGGYFGKYCDKNRRFLDARTDLPRTGGTLPKWRLALVIHDMLHFVLCLQNHLAWVVDAAAIAFESRLSQSCTSIQDISAECNAFTTRIAEAYRGVSDSMLSLSPLLNAIIHLCSCLGNLAHYNGIEETNDEEMEQEIEKLERETLVTINEYTRRKRRYLHSLLQLRAESVIGKESAKQFSFIFDPTGRYSFV